MTTQVFTTAGTKVFVSTTLPTTVTSAGFAAITVAQWKEVGEVVDLGDNIGRTYNLVTHNPVGTRKTTKLKGTFNDGALTLQMAERIGDEGQAILRTALNSDANISVRITKGNPGTAQRVAFVGLVMSSPMSLGSADTVTGLSCLIEIDSEVVTLA
jgi:hypothetical protein